MTTQLRESGAECVASLEGIPLGIGEPACTRATAGGGGGGGGGGSGMCEGKEEGG